MPIYSYRCDHCGHQQDVLQKMSDPLLVTCPACGQPGYRKQVTAAGFQLKGSGWYVTDFRNAAAKEGTKSVSKEADAGGAKEGTTTAESGAAAPKADKPAAPAPARSDATPAPAPSSGGNGGGTSGGTS